MSYIGSTPTTQAFSPTVDIFSGNGSATVLSLSKPVLSAAQVQVVVNNVPQNPASAFTVGSQTITFTSAPSAGTNNIYVYYVSPITQTIAPSQGTVSTSSLIASFVLPVVSGGTGVQSSTGSGSVVLGTSPTLTTPIVTTTMGVGSATPSVSGSGITFPATQSASSDANTLDDYEEGTWTPSVSSLVGTITTVGAVSGVYTKIGNTVVAEFTIAITTNGTGSNAVQIASLPFSATANAYIGCGRENSVTGKLQQLYLTASTSTITMKNYDDTYPAGNGYTFFGTITYRTS